MKNLSRKRPLRKVEPLVAAVMKESGSPEDARTRFGVHPLREGMRSPSVVFVGVDGLSTFNSAQQHAHLMAVVVLTLVNSRFVKKAGHQTLRGFEPENRRNSMTTSYSFFIYL